MIKERLTFEDLPNAIAVLLDKIEALAEKVEGLKIEKEDKDEPQWLNVAELSAYLPSHPKEQTIYSWTCSHKIPFHKKGRNIMFDKKEIDEWLLGSTHYKSEQELEQEAMQFVNSKRVYKIDNI